MSEAIDQMLRLMPIKAWPCGRCAFAREATSELFAEHHIVCGWWDDRDRTPLLTPFNPGEPTEAVRACTRKQAYGPHDPALGEHHCSQFAEKAAVAEAVR